MKDRVTDLLGRLEALLRRKGPGREALDLVRMIHDALPGELREAQRMREEAERVLQAAQDEARRIVTEAQATARHLVEEHALAKEATRRGQDLLTRAEHDAQAVRDGADAYAGRVLADLEERVMRVLEAIRRGRELLKDDQTAAYNEKSGR